MLCKACHRVLKTEESKKLGYGPVCYVKIFGKPEKIKKFDAEEKDSWDIPGQIDLDEWLDTLE